MAKITPNFAGPCEEALRHHGRAERTINHCLGDAMTHIYFIRHAEPNYANHDDRSRELTQKGLRDREKVSEYLMARQIDAVLSSPYRRAYDTVKHFADAQSLPVEVVDAFRERRVDSVWIEDFNAFARKQWADFGYRLSDGECLREVQERNISALFDVLRRYEGKSVAIGSHGTALGTIINYFDPTFGYESFRIIQPIMPLIAHFTCDGEKIHSIEWIDPMHPEEVVRA